MGLYKILEFKIMSLTNMILIEVYLMKTIIRK